MQCIAFKLVNLTGAANSSGEEQTKEAPVEAVALDQEETAVANHDDQEQQRTHNVINNNRSSPVSNKSSEDFLDQDSAFSLSHKSSICSANSSNSFKPGRTPSEFTCSIAGRTE